jgi:fucose permease
MTVEPHVAVRPVARPLARRRWANTAGFFLYALMPGVWAVRIPSVQDARHLSVGVLGACLLAPAVGAVVAMPLAGSLVARWGSRRAVRASAVVMAVALPLLAVAPTVLGFVVALAVFGAAAATLDVALNVQAVDVESSYGRSLMSGMHAAWSLGALAGTGVGAATAAAHVRPSVALFVTALVAGPGLLWVAGALADVAAPSSGAFAMPDRRTALLGMLVFCSLFVEATAGDWSAVYLHRSVGVSLAAAGAGFATFSAAMIGGRLVGDRVVDRVGPVAATRWPALAGAVAMIVAVSTQTVAASLVGFFLAGAGTAILFPMAMVAAGRDRDDAARAIAGAATVGYLGWVVAPGLIGAVAAAVSLPVAVGISAGFLALAAILAGTLAGPWRDPD